MLSLEDILAACPELIASPLALRPRESAKLCRVSRAFLAFACSDAVWRPLLLGHKFHVGKLGAPLVAGAAILRAWERLDKLGDLSDEELIQELHVRDGLCSMLGGSLASLAGRAAATIVSDARKEPLALTPAEHEVLLTTLRRCLAWLLEPDLVSIDGCNVSGKMRCLYLIATWAEYERVALAANAVPPTCSALFRRVDNRDLLGAGQVPGEEVEGRISMKGNTLILQEGDMQWPYCTIDLSEGYPGINHGEYVMDIAVRARPKADVVPPGPEEAPPPGAAPRVRMRYTSARFSIDTNEADVTMDIDLRSEAIGAAWLERISLSSTSRDMPNDHLYHQYDAFESLMRDALRLSEWGAPVNYVMQGAMLRLGLVCDNLVRDSFAKIEWGELDPPGEFWGLA